MISATITVGDKPTALVGSGSPVTHGRAVRLKNASSTSKLIIGGSDVRPDSGWVVDAGETLDLGAVDSLGDGLYGIRGGGADIPVNILSL
jgi:hypothetical protein